MDRLNEDVLIKTMQSLQSAHQAEVEELQREIVRLKNQEENREHAFYRAIGVDEGAGGGWQGCGIHVDFKAQYDLKVIGTCQNPHCGKIGHCTKPRTYKRHLYEGRVYCEYKDFNKQVSNITKLDCPCGMVICEECCHHLGDNWKYPDEIDEIENEEERQSAEDDFFEKINEWCCTKTPVEYWCSDCYIKHIWNKPE
jgi:hypothetical protein